MNQAKTVRGAAAKLFIEQPERLAAAWRRVRYTAMGHRGFPDNLLDGCIDDFVRQIGHSLRGLNGEAWSRTRGVLRLSLGRGRRALQDEFSALRQCLIDALMVVDAETSEHAIVERSVQEALESCIAMSRRLVNPELPLPRVAFGGLVVELIECQPRPRLVEHQTAATVH